MGVGGRVPRQRISTTAGRGRAGEGWASLAKGRAGAKSRRGSKIWILWEKMEELGGVAVWPQVRLGTMALTAQDEALGPVNNPPRPTPGFTLAAAGLVEAVTRSQAEDILGRLTCRHSGGCLCACVCTRVCLGGAVAGATLRSHLGLGRGPSCQFPGPAPGVPAPPVDNGVSVSKATLAPPTSTLHPGPFCRPRASEDTVAGCPGSLSPYHIPHKTTSKELGRGCRAPW